MVVYWATIGSGCSHLVESVLCLGPGKNIPLESYQSKEFCCIFLIFLNQPEQFQQERTSRRDDVPAHILVFTESLT